MAVDVQKTLKGGWMPGATANPGGVSGAFQHIAQAIRRQEGPLQAALWLFEYRDDRDNPPSLRLEAHKTLMAYAYGKPRESTDINIGITQEAVKFIEIHRADSTAFDVDGEAHVIEGRATDSDASDRTE